jgi:type III secretion protein N (ATPase)
MSNKLIEIFNDYKLKFDKQITSLDSRVNKVSTIREFGKIDSAIGTVITATMRNVKVGDLCEIINYKTGFRLKSEVLAIDGDKVILLPFGNIKNIAKDYLIYKINADGFVIKVSDFLLGKVINGFGEIQGTINEPLQKEDYSIHQEYAIEALAPDSMQRPIISDVFKTGVTAIDMFVTCGYGQRIGVFAKAGLGKTTLMGMILRDSTVDVVVVALIGERGREVKEFIEIELNETLRKKCVLVVSTSDKPPIEQAKCAFVAQTIAEYFRDQGKKVLLFVDSITRFARATREIGLSAGEPPVRSGYPPSSFLSFPRLMERAGNNHLGSITAFYTVLLETDNFNEDPIADEVKSILDGHVILSNKLANLGHFPAIDILSSLSRIADRIISPKHLAAARHIRMLISKYHEIEFLIKVGEYTPGTDKIADEAIAKYSKIMSFLKQTNHDSRTFDANMKLLLSLV